MARFTYIPNRVIDSDGISDGANIYFYQTGTTTPITVYSDSGLTTPVSNPYPVAAGAAVPALYFAESQARVRVIDSSGAVVSDDDPWVFVQAGSVAFAGGKTVEDLTSNDANEGASLIGTTDGDTVQAAMDQQKFGATLRQQDPADDAYQNDTPLDYNASPTNDATKIQAVLDDAANLGFADLATGGYGSSITTGLRYRNAYGAVFGKAYSPITAAPSGTIDVMLGPAVWEDNAATFPTSGFNDKLNHRAYDISLNGNVGNGATVGIGYLAIPSNGLETGFKIRNVSGKAYSLTHQNEAADASPTGNLLINRMIAHSVENPAGTPGDYGYYMGDASNAKLTDGECLFLHAYSYEIGMYIGSGQGWQLYGTRLALTDDGLTIGQSNRTFVTVPIVDEFGHGHDGAQTEFHGIDLGRLTDTDGSDAGLIGGQILSRATAGNTASETYYGVRFGCTGNTTTGHALTIADTHIHLEGDTANTIAFLQDIDDADARLTGVIHDAVVTGDYTGETVENLFAKRSGAGTVTAGVLSSPYMKAHHVSHGKKLPFYGLNDRGHQTRNLDDLDSLGGVTSEWNELRFSKNNVTSDGATPTNFATLTLYAGAAMNVEVEVMATAGDSNGYATRSETFKFAAGMYSSSVAPNVSSVANPADTGAASQSGGVRSIDAIAISATPSVSNPVGTVTLAVTITVSGSSAPANCDVVWRVKTMGTGSSVGQTSIQAA